MGFERWEKLGRMCETTPLLFLLAGGLFLHLSFQILISTQQLHSVNITNIKPFSEIWWKFAQYTIYLDVNLCLGNSFCKIIVWQVMEEERINTGKSTEMELKVIWILNYRFIFTLHANCFQFQRSVKFIKNLTFCQRVTYIPNTTVG